MWIFKGEVFDKAELARAEAEGEAAAAAAAAPAPAAAARRRPPLLSPLPRPRPKHAGRLIGIRSMSMLQPKRTKYRKMFKGRNAGLAHARQPTSPSATSV